MKVLYIDFEQGYKSLGSPDDIKQNFGYPLLQFDKYSDFKKLLGGLFERKTVQEEVQVGGIKVPQESTRWVAKEGVDIDRYRGRERGRDRDRNADRDIIRVERDRKKDRDRGRV